MTLRVPTAKIASVGMRKLPKPPLVKRALETLKGRARVKRTMWSRRAQEYEAKINSGDIVAIAEVVRDLFRSDTQPEQSYSSANSMRQRSTGSRAKSRRCSASPRPKRSRRSRRRSPRALAAVRSPPRVRPRTRLWSRKRRRKPASLSSSRIQGPAQTPGFLLRRAATCPPPLGKCRGNTPAQSQLCSVSKEDRGLGDLTGVGGHAGASQDIEHVWIRLSRRAAGLLARSFWLQIGAVVNLRSIRCRRPPTSSLPGSHSTGMKRPPTPAPAAVVKASYSALAGQQALLTRGRPTNWRPRQSIICPPWPTPRRPRLWCPGWTVRRHLTWRPPKPRRRRKPPRCQARGSNRELRQVLN